MALPYLGSTKGWGLKAAEEGALSLCPAPGSWPRALANGRRASKAARLRGYGR